MNIKGSTSQSDTQLIKHDGTFLQIFHIDVVTKKMPSALSLDVVFKTAVVLKIEACFESKYQN